MTFIFQVDELPTNKTFDIFKSKKPVAIGDKVMYQTTTEEVTHTINTIHASKGLMKGWSAVGFEIPKATQS